MAIVTTSTARARAARSCYFELGARFQLALQWLLPVFPIFAFYDLITCLIVMLTELLEPRL